MKFLNNIIDIKETSDIGLTGLTDEFFSVYITNLLRKEQRDIIILTATLYEANKIVNSLSNYTDDVYLFPMDDFLTSEAISISPDLKITRLETLNATMLDRPKIIVTHLMGYLRFLPSKKVYKDSIITLKKGLEIDPKTLTENLYSIGYHRQTLVTTTGEMGVRGFVIDVFPINEHHPLRIEFFGDEIDSIRYFDEETQKSISEKDMIEIYPFTEFIANNVDAYEIKHKYLPDYQSEVVNIRKYLNNPITIIKDYKQVDSTYFHLQEEILSYRSEKEIDFKKDYMFSYESLRDYKEILYMSVDNKLPDKLVSKVYHFDTKEILNFNENIELINKYLQENLYLNKTILICLKPYQIKNFSKHLTCDYILTSEEEIFPNRVNIIEKELNKGFIYENYIVITDKELFNLKESKKKYKTNFKYASKIKDINKLNIGDYIVHNIHGIGIYNGIKTLSKGELVKDYIEILYLGKDKLYIPVEKIDLISKYSGKEGSVPKMHKLGGSEWQKTKLRVREKVRDIADKLIKLYASREAKKGFMYSADNELQNSFEKEFKYDETKDQLLAIEQIKEDMESSQPMDRLLCGDVGYGKTEVAFRAIFKAVMDSKQVLFLCPTTILSNQHYETALERFKNYPIRFGLLNRFTSRSEAKRILKELEDGTIDVVIGTHRLLSNDIKPHDLGLLVIDEEQRFGVSHKEKIKEYKNNIDVLTLTATPIPRTLQMSMTGIRSLSLIETPPVNRYPVQTYVIEENLQIIKDAIYKELSRNGQVFLLYNRVEDIEQKALEVSTLVPEAKIVFAHGQMSKTELEDTMLKFINHEFDVLVCTTIIETGIDIPNANTLIIIDADRFGLSQLYQIRGRVGRSNKIAYAYLMYNANKVLSETAIKRLNVIKEFTELGSGFSIATRDLSIRGAGDILGSEQAGFIDTIGIDLYLKILNDEVNRLKGDEVSEEIVKDEKPLLEVNTHIDNDYVEEADLKIEIHRKINEIDSLDKLNKIKAELEDRFGRLNEDIIIYMYEEWFEKLAKNLEIEKINQTKNSIELILSENITKRIDSEKLFVDAYKITNMFRFGLRANKLSIILDTIKLEKHYIYYLVELLSGIVIK